MGKARKGYETARVRTVLSRHMVGPLIEMLIPFGPCSSIAASSQTLADVPTSDYRCLEIESSATLAPDVAYEVTLRSLFHET